MATESIRRERWALRAMADPIGRASPRASSTQTLSLKITRVSGKNLPQIQKKILSPGVHCNTASMLEKRHQLELLDRGLSNVIVAIQDSDLEGVGLLQERTWDSNHFGIRIGSLDVLESFSDTYKRKKQVDLALLRYFYPQIRQFRYVTCRVRIEDLAGANALEEVGFAYLAGMVTLTVDIRKATLRPFRCSSITPVATTEISQLVRMAQRSFRQDRFHQDDQLSKLMSDRLHGEWIRNCCEKKLADIVLVSHAAKRPTGFVACRKKSHTAGPPVGEIILLGVAPAYQGRGIGPQLVRSALQWFFNKVDTVVVRTEATNLPSISVYQKEGFSLGGASSYFRKWN